MFQGGSSRKQGPRLAMRDADDKPPRDAPVRPCEWPFENFMDRAGIKEEFNAYLHNADLVSFEEESAAIITISLVPLWGGLNFHLHVILQLSCLIFIILYDGLRGFYHCLQTSTMG